MVKNAQPQDEQDAPWKKVLRQYFREATEFFFPNIAQVVDWTKPIEFLDKEFLKIAPDAATGKRFADQLVKVHILVNPPPVSRFCVMPIQSGDRIGMGLNCLEPN